MHQEAANATLEPVTELRKYTVQEPKLPYAIPSVLHGPSEAYLSVPPVTYDGYTEAQYQRLLKMAGVKTVATSVSSHAVHEVVGAQVNKNGRVSVAVVWSEETTGGGTWITLEDLNVLFDNKCCDSEEDNDNEDDDNHKRHDQKTSRR
jgi:hypothetical protein